MDGNCDAEVMNGIVRNCWMSLLMILVVRGEDFQPEVTESGSPPSPQEVIAGMKVPEGFRVELFASEPQVREPIDMTVDDAGRVWVAEAYSYMNWPRTARGSVFDDEGSLVEVSSAQGGLHQDRIVVLSDTDGDGRADERRVAIEGLSHLSSVAVGWGGVWVLDLPNLLFYPDKNGDGIIEGEAIIKLTGFSIKGLWNMPNSLTWGPDGWLYGVQGQLAWSRIREESWWSCGVWRYHPVEDRFEVMANGMTNPWGIDWNAEGDCFVSGNCNGHLWSIYHGGYYERGWGGATMAMGWRRFSSIEKVPHYPPESHWKSAWLKRFEMGSEADAYGGGHSHCGLLIYQGGLWPEKYEERTIMANTFGRRLNVDRLGWEGCYISERQEDLMKVDTEWFRGVSIEQDVDGNVLVSDWCDKGECHDESGVHRSSGRIYRLCYGEAKKRERVDLRSLKDDSVLVGYLKNENNYYQRRSSRLLMEKLRVDQVSAKTLESLVVMMKEGDTWAERVIALQTLAGGGRLASVVEAALLDPESRVRAMAVKLLVSSREVIEPKMVALLSNLMEKEEDERVLWQLASALRGSGFRTEHVYTLLKKAQNENLIRMIWHSSGGRGKLNAVELLGFYRNSVLLVGRMEALDGLIDLGADEELYQILQEVPQLKVDEGNEILRSLSQALDDRFRPSFDLAQWRVLRDRLVKWGNQKTLTYLISFGRVMKDSEAYLSARKIFRNQKFTVDERVEALRQMLLFDSKQSRFEFLEAWQEQGLRLKIIPLISEVSMGFDYFVVSSVKLSAEEKQALVKEMLESKQGAADLMSFIREGIFPPQVIKGGNFKFLEIVAPDLAHEFRKEYGEGDSDALFRRCKALVVKNDGEAKVGKEVFGRLCAHCHRFQGGQADLGPDLSGYDFRDTNSLLHHIIFPSEVVAADARMMVVTMTDGTVVSGTSLGETVRGDIRVKTSLGETVVIQARVREVQFFEDSIMPEGLLHELPDDEIRGLVKYLQGGEK